MQRHAVNAARCGARYAAASSRYLVRRPCRSNLSSLLALQHRFATSAPPALPQFPGPSLHETVLPRENTIYALSTAPGRAGIAIIRVSGPACLDIYKALCPSKAIPKPRYASVRTLYDPVLGEENILDSDAIVLYLPGPGTVTGEEMLEFHIHGGPATVKAVLAAISRCASTSAIRYAEPGEFTRRAFQNNRLDLAQVEALSDALSAETEQQRRAAVRGNSGALGRTYEDWRQKLLYARGELEAIIDFSEDQDFDEENSELLKNIEAGVKKIRQSIRVHEEGSRRGELLRKGIRISLLGPPNAGKSSLLNRIVGREASIVSTEAGTTRDVVEISLDVDGYLCTIADTAGLRSYGTQGFSNFDRIGAVEQEGIRRAKAKAEESDVVIVLASIEGSPNKGWQVIYDHDALEIASKAKKYLVILNKVDLVSSDVLERLLNDFEIAVSQILSGTKAVAISCKPAISDPSATDTGNIKQLINNLVESFKDLTTSDYQDFFGVTERQRQLLEKCDAHLHDYLQQTQDHSPEGLGFDIVLAAEHLRSAADCLSRITGRGEAGDVEEVLGVVFEKFCVGK